jgi:hypothetical protein
MHFHSPHVRMDTAVDGTQGGAGAGAGAGAAAAAPPPNALQAGAAAPAPAPAPGAAPASPNAWLPEKHQVMKADGTLDLEASARKVADAYGHAERRIGTGDIPPQAVDGYKVNVPEALAEKIKAEDLAKSEDFKDFLGKMHAAGLTQKQLDAVSAEMLERGIKLREQMPALDAAKAEADLRTTDGWKTDQEYGAKVRAAFSAGKQYGGEDFDGILADYGNDPRVIRLLANVGAELAEDTQPSAEAQAQAQQSLDELMADPAYTNSRDPKHAMHVAKVNAMQAKVAGTKELATGGRSMSFKTG